MNVKLCLILCLPLPLLLLTCLCFCLYFFLTVCICYCVYPYHASASASASLSVSSAYVSTSLSETVSTNLARYSRVLFSTFYFLLFKELFFTKLSVLQAGGPLPDVRILVVDLKSSSLTSSYLRGPPGLPRLV